MAFAAPALVLFIVTAFVVWSERGKGAQVLFSFIALAILCSIGGLVVAATSGGA